MTNHYTTAVKPEIQMPYHTYVHTVYIHISANAPPATVASLLVKPSAWLVLWQSERGFFNRGHIVYTPQALPLLEKHTTALRDAWMFTACSGHHCLRTRDRGHVHLRLARLPPHNRRTGHDLPRRLSTIRLRKGAVRLQIQNICSVNVRMCYYVHKKNQRSTGGSEE